MAAGAGAAGSAGQRMKPPVGRCASPGGLQCCVPGGAAGLNLVTRVGLWCSRHTRVSGQRWGAVYLHGLTVGTGPQCVCVSERHVAHLN